MNVASGAELRRTGVQQSNGIPHRAAEAGIPFRKVGEHRTRSGRSRGSVAGRQDAHPAPNRPRVPVPDRRPVEASQP